jgi:hypothetical protein
VKIERVMERVYDRRRLHRAWQAVKRNAGAAGEIPADDDQGRLPNSRRKTDLDKDEQVAIGHETGS